MDTEESRGGKSLSQKWYEAMSAESEISDGLLDRGLEDFDRLGCDDYDNSVEIHGAPDDARLTPEAVSWLMDHCGFSKIYLNHKDGWETHYSGHSNRRGWRRRYVQDATSPHDHVLAGDPDPGYFEISFWPDGWDKQRGWLESGYMRIVPDPLEALSPSLKEQEEGN